MAAEWGTFDYKGIVYSSLTELLRLDKSTLMCREAQVAGSLSVCCFSPVVVCIKPLFQSTWKVTVHSGAALIKASNYSAVICATCCADSQEESSFALTLVCVRVQMKGTVWFGSGRTAVSASSCSGGREASSRLGNAAHNRCLCKRTGTLPVMTRPWSGCSTACRGLTHGCTHERWSLH